MITRAYRSPRRRRLGKSKTTEQPAWGSGPSKEKLDDDLSIYRSRRTKQGVWTARVTIPSEYRTAKWPYKDENLRTLDIQTARRRAWDFHRRILKRTEQGIPLTALSLSQLHKRWERSSAHLSETRIKGVEQTVRLYLVPFLESWGFDRNTPVEKISKEAINSYVSWVEANHSLSKSYIELHIQTWNQLINYGFKNDLLSSENDKRMPNLKDIVGAGVKRKITRQSLYTYVPEQIAVINKFLGNVYLRPFYNSYCSIVDNKFRRDEQGRVICPRRQYLGRTNLAGLYWLMLGTGLRVSEARRLRWRDISAEYLPGDSKYPRKIYLITVKETKAFRVKNDYTHRHVIGPPSLSGTFEKIKKENPLFCSLDDYVFNDESKKPLLGKTQWRNVLERAEEWQRSKGNEICLTKHKDTGARLTLSHVRSAYITNALLDRGISAASVAQQCGNSIEVCERYYLARSPRLSQKLALGRHKVEVATELVSDEALRPFKRTGK